MRLLSQASYRFNTIPIKIPMVHATEPRQIFFKLYGNTKTLQTAKTNSRKNKIVGIGLDLKLYYKTTVIKTVWY